MLHPNPGRSIIKEKNREIKNGTRVEGEGYQGNFLNLVCGTPEKEKRKSKK